MASMIGELNGMIDWRDKGSWIGGMSSPHFNNSKGLKVLFN
jgi:hypothetical protein